MKKLSWIYALLFAGLFSLPVSAFAEEAPEEVSEEASAPLKTEGEPLPEEASVQKTEEEPEGIAAALRNRDTVLLKGGEKVAGTILMMGERGIVMAVEEAGAAERFIALDSVVEVMREKVTGSESSAVGSLVSYYQVKSENGMLVLKEGDSASLSAAQAEKTRAAQPERTSRGNALRQELEQRREAERERRRKESSFGIQQKDRNTSTEEEERARELLDLFGGEEEASKRREPLLESGGSESEK